MAWTATLEKVQLVDGDAVATMVFTDGAAKFDEQVKVRGMRQSAFLQDYVRDRIKQLNDTSTWVAQVTLGTITPSIEPTPSTPTAAEIARATWERNYQRLLAWQRAVSVGLESQTDPLYTDLQAQVLADKLNSYRQLY